ncbi:hypothetical protein [Colwellia sp. Bg11-28]|uniref:hypothetical protein n=1 Tax=Colwellia sp. Bg11-28 TaxID=2058305 RepID=UPI000C32FFA0|nr:hypothetical protein [Colwellia sp. Bg11-28]PKH85447.1 hypothetical protein CXF79_19485 [Colwellia sp. Bg11-28]
MSDDFFAGLETNKPEIKLDAVLKIKEYPAWVEQKNKPEKTMIMYDVVIDLFDKAVAMIEDKSFTRATEVTLSQAQVCEAIPFFKGRSGLKNHPLIVDEMDARNKELVRLLAEYKEKTGKSTARKTLDMVKAELADYKEDYVAKTQIELDRLINSELLVSQSDALNEIARSKMEMAELRKELATVQHANTKLQNENFRLQQRILTTGKPTLTAEK